MKVKIDLGTQEELSPSLLGHIVDVITKETAKVNKESPAKLAKATLYLNFYDEDGNLVDLVNKNNEVLNYSYRSTPYKVRRGKIDDPITLRIMDKDGSSIICEGYLYPRWDKE